MVSAGGCAPPGSSAREAPGLFPTRGDTWGAENGNREANLAYDYFFDYTYYAQFEEEC